MRIFISSNSKNLAAKLAEFQYTATVEAEYGDDVVEGSVLTLAHHGPRKDQPNPCLHPNSENGSINISSRPGDLTSDMWIPIQAIGISHVDLDTIGGVAALMGKKPGPENFWKLAAWIDSNGPHRGGDHPAYNDHKDHLNAYYAFSETNKYWPPKDGSVADVTELVEKTTTMLTDILYGMEVPGITPVGVPMVASEWIEKGREWFKRLQEIELRSLIEEGRVRIFASDQFCSAFYRNGDGSIADATVVYSTKSGAISLAFEDGGKRWNAARILQELFGPEAGGHAGIAGSPRGKRMNFAQFNMVVEKIRILI